MLTNSDIAELTAFRRHLHRHPEISGEEAWTGAEIAAELRKLAPGGLVSGLGGHGLAAVWQGAAPGPTVLFRSETDALPIHETPRGDHSSTRPGTAHLCGHDGHSTILLGLARLLARRPPARGRVVLLFQPAEETGAGAAAVLADPRFAPLTPDWSFSLHNMPGIPLGQVALQAGPAACASEGMAVTFTGHTSHASTPQFARSPALALAALIPAAMAAGPGGALDPGFRLVTVTHVRMGEPVFGITPGEAQVYLTLRCLLDADMKELRDRLTSLALDLTTAHGLTVSFTAHDRFAASTNDPEATEVLTRALAALQIPRVPGHQPMRPSEDFGLFGSISKSAMLFLGAGEHHPNLHNPDYDFPDDLIPIGARIFDRTLRDLLDGWLLIFDENQCRSGLDLARDDEIHRHALAEAHIGPGLDGEIADQGRAGGVFAEFGADRCLGYQPVREFRDPRIVADHHHAIALGMLQHRHHHIRPGMIQRRLQLQHRRARQRGRDPGKGLAGAQAVGAQHLIRHIAARGQPLPQVCRRSLAPLVQRPVVIRRHRVVPAGLGVARQDQALHLWNCLM